ncbi:hypothetical protein EV368DRAFT_62580 [Lentinula lateritia]|nr:hypothetical protein EV368DRAFT_62580 [Lentinula lateritia]
MTRTTGENIKRLVRKYSVKDSQMNKFGFPAEEHVQDVIHSRLKPDLETELSLEDILSKYVFVVMHDEDDYNLQMTLSNPGHITLSAPQNTLLSWDTVEGTYERASLTGSFTDGVGYMGKKVVGGVDGKRGLTVDERVKLDIGHLRMSRHGVE